MYPSQPTPSTIPVVYHHQPAMVNPPWYYNHMVLYPISPHPGYSVPAYPSMVNSPILQPYPNAVMTHPLSNNSPRMGGGVRISNAIPEPMTSPTLPGGVVFRPLSQSSTVQVCTCIMYIYICTLIMLNCIDKTCIIIYTSLVD